MRRQDINTKCRRRVRAKARLLKLVVAGTTLVISPVAPASAQIVSVPTFEVSTRSGQQSILIGSLHVGVRGMLKPNPIALLTRARRLVVEHKSPPAPAEDKSAGRAQWATRLSDSQIETLVERARCAGLGRDEALKLLQFRSAQRANQVAYTVCGPAGRVQSRDDWINATWAHIRGSKPDVLEDDVWVEQQRMRIRDDDSDAALQWILGRDPQAVLQAVVIAMNRGDYDELARIQMESFGDPAAARRYNQVMLVERNLYWMPRLKRFIDEGGAVVVVGAMHLQGEHGLVSLLRADGYEVRQASVPAFMEDPHLRGEQREK